MKPFRDPNAALQHDENEMPLYVRIICGIVWAVLVLVAVWVSTHVGSR